MSESRKRIPPEKIPFYLLNTVSTELRNRIGGLSKEDQVSEIAKLKAEQSLPVFIQILLQIDGVLKNELQLSQVYAYRFSQDEIQRSREVVEHALAVFFEADRVLNMNLISKAFYVMHSLKAEELFASLEALVTNTNNIAVTDKTSALWREFDVWASGLYELTAQKTRVNGVAKKVTISGKLEWPAVDTEDDRMMQYFKWKTKDGVRPVGKMLISEYYHWTAKALEKRIYKLEHAFPESFDHLTSLINDANLLAPKNRHGMFAGQVNAPLRKINHHWAAISGKKDLGNRDYSEVMVESLQAIESIAQGMGVQHPIALAAKKCLASYVFSVKRKQPGNSCRI